MARAMARAGDPDAPLPLRRWRITAPLLLIVAGVVAMSWPGSPLEGQEYVLGVLAVGGGLAGLVFANSPLSFRDTLWRHRLEVGSIILLTGFGLGIVLVWTKGSLAAIGTLGLIVLVTTLLGSNVLSGSRELTKEEVGIAIALSCISMFYALIGFGPKEELPDGVLSDTIEHFWQVLIWVVGFFFAKGAVDVVATRFGRATAEPPEARPAPPPEGRAPDGPRADG
jgi:uncharacterized membrane protein HdeD (DUF308 family)